MPDERAQNFRREPFTGHEGVQIGELDGDRGMNEAVMLTIRPRHHKLIADGAHEGAASVLRLDVIEVLRDLDLSLGLGFVRRAGYEDLEGDV
jgi:hypothetical protein